MLTTSYLFRQLWATFMTKLIKRPIVFFLIYRHFNFIFTCLQNFLVRKLKTKICHLFQYANKTLFIPATLNNIFDNNCNFKVWFNLYSVAQFYHDHIFTTEMVIVSILLTNCYLFWGAYSLPSAFSFFSYSAFTFQNICSFR